MTSSMWCSIMRIVRSYFFLICMMNWPSSSVSCGFIPAAGSSRSSSFGSVARARAISSRRCKPYGRDVASSFRYCTRFCSSSSSIVSFSMRRSSATEMRSAALNTFCLARMCLAVRTFSNTVMDFHRRMFWNVRAMPSFVIWSGVGSRIFSLRYISAFMP